MFVPLILFLLQRSEAGGQHPSLRGRFLADVVATTESVFSTSEYGEEEGTSSIGFEVMWNDLIDIDHQANLGIRNLFPPTEPPQIVVKVVEKTLR